MKNLRCALLLSIVALVPASHAAMIRLTASGTVTASNMVAFSVGQTVTSSFIYDSTVTPQFTANQQGFFVNPFTYVELNIGSYSSSYAGSFGQINMYDNIGNTDGITFQFSWHPALYQFTNPKPNAVTLDPVFSTILQSFGELRVNLGSAGGTVFNGFTLPTSYDFNDFTANRSILLGFSDGSLMAGFSSLTVQDVSPTPEPAAWTLIAVGLIGISAVNRLTRVHNRRVTATCVDRV